MFPSEEMRAAETARLNDIARGDPGRANARLVMTAGVVALIREADGRNAELALSLASFSEFQPGNDPYGERDFGAFTLWGERLIWKIDYYDLAMKGLSPAPWSVELTNRVLTIMRASEY